MASRDQALMIPEILMVIKSFLPLFECSEASQHGLIDTWNPDYLLSAAAVCKAWRQILIPVLWQTYDFAIMDWAPWDVLTHNIRHIRQLSLLNTKHKKNAAFWEVLTYHKHIRKLEVHDAIFPVKRLLGPKVHNVKELKVSGNCTRMHPFLLLFVARQVALQSLELTRVKLTKSDWTRIVYNKPHLNKLIISQQCEFEGFEDDNDEDKNKTRTAHTKGKQPVESMAMDADPAANTNSCNASTSSGGGSNKRKAMMKGSVEAVTSADAPRRSSSAPPFQKVIFKACPHVEQLKICYTQKAVGSTIANLVAESCPKIRHLTLTSTRQPWTLAMLEKLIPHTGQLDLDMVAAVNDRKDMLTRLELNFGQDSKGKRRMECILLILRACSELREFTYHNHAEDKLFKEVMFKKAWNLPNLRKLHIHGVSPRVQHNSLPQVPVPNSWRQENQVRKHRCCSSQSMQDIRNLGSRSLSPLFDVALLDQIKDLSNLSKVVITEAKYRKRLN
ncbi:hypothetical protein BGZ47_009209 [Haplosporangium gracile]|nr:hypothetical protein BGZ47_009209 [Haplosporangium gracile]